jgi:SPP1 family predicted phage head-tail adaptor
MQKIGTLDKRVHLLGYKDVKNDNGFYEQQFVDLVGHPVYARIEPARGKSFYEQYEANKDASTYMLKITIRYRKGIDENTVVQYGDNLYNVITAIDPYMRHEKLELMVNQRKRGAEDDD